MSQIVRDHLLALIAQDPSIGDDPRRCEALLRDLCRNEHRKEITALVTAIRERVVTEIRTEATGVAPGRALMARLRQRLHDDCGLREDVSLWTIETWAAAYAVPVTTSQPTLATSRSESDSSQARTRAVVQHRLHEYFVAASAGSRAHYSPHIGARVRVHYVDIKANLDLWQTTYYLAPVGMHGPEWARADTFAESGPDLRHEPAADSTYSDAPALMLSASEHKQWGSALEDHVYRSVALALPSCPALELTASVGMSEGEFRSRVALAVREKRDAAVEALRKQYAARLGAIEDRNRRLSQKVATAKAEASDKTLSTTQSVGGRLLGALYGGGRRASSSSKERADVAYAEAETKAIRSQLESLNSELEAQVARLDSEFDPATIAIETTSVKPRKGDIAVEDLALVWVP